MEEPKITSGAVPYIASEIPDDPRDHTRAVGSDEGG